jgi:trehalose 6-phosphate synthase/phosphatase
MLDSECIIHEFRVRAERFPSFESSQQRLICVANRLPSTAVCDAQGIWKLKRSTGGLASALSAVENLHMSYIGWPGADIPQEHRAAISQELAKHLSFPVFLDHSEIELYYTGFSNGVLWPLFHYVTPAVMTGSHEPEWTMYARVNRIFAEAIAQVLREKGNKDTLVWIHDYHLMLVPKFLRELVPEANIGFFLHTPFPAPDLFRMLPYREDILHGLLSSNYIAFQTKDYCRHFIASVSQLTNLQVTENTVDALPIGGALVACGHVPIGIDPQPFIDASTRNETVVEKIFEIREQYGTDRKIILGVDRLDYMKGIQHKLQAFEKFLDNHPEWAGNCVLVQLAVPSRSECKDYQRLRKTVHELVGQLCGKHSHITSGPPVLYLDQAIDFQGLVALYRAADVMLVTSIRDGMNLVAFEYVASQEGNNGVLVLSEFTGALMSMGGGALRVNPWNLEQTSEAIHRALTMGEEERRSRHQFCFDYVINHTAQRWAETFIENLKNAVSETEAIRACVPPLLPMEDLIESWVSSWNQRKIIFLDLVDCLVSPITSSGRALVSHPNFGSLPFDVRRSFEKYLLSGFVTVVVITPHRRELLDHLFAWVPPTAELSLVLVAENGVVFKTCTTGSRAWAPVLSAEEEQDVGPFHSQEWRQEIYKLIDFLKEQAPGTFMEESAFSLKWFTETSVTAGALRELLLQRWAGPLGDPQVEVVLADRYVEIRPRSISLSQNLRKLIHNPALHILFKEPAGVSVAIGSFPYRDEDAYQAIEEGLGALWAHQCATSPVEEHAAYKVTNVCDFFSVVVGHAKISKAKYSLPTRYHVQNMLVSLAERPHEERVRGA